MELLDILDENGKITGKVESREVVHQKGLWHMHVGIWIMNEKGELLLQKRAETKKRNPNKWARTGGHADSGETPIVAMQRETEEEIGVKIPINKIELLYKEKVRANEFNCHFVYNYCALVNYKIEEYTMQKEEVSDLKYITIEELEEKIRNKDENYTIAEYTNPNRIIEILKKKREKLYMEVANEKKSHSRELEDEYASR